MNVEELIKRCVKGDEKSQYEFYRYCFDLLMPVCMRYKENESDAVAALNTTYLKILNKASSKKKEVKFNPWAKRIAINQLIDEYRKNKRRHSLQVDMDPAEIQFVSSQFTPSEIELDVNAEEIMRFIQQLQEPGRTVFNLHALEGFSHDEIAKKMGLTPENSRYHLHAARKILRKNLSKRIKQSKLA